MVIQIPDQCFTFSVNLTDEIKFFWDRNPFHVEFMNNWLFE